MFSFIKRNLGFRSVPTTYPQLDAVTQFLTQEAHAAAQENQRSRLQAARQAQGEAPQTGEDFLASSVIFQIKLQSLGVVADLNRGTVQDNCDVLARQMAWVQKELIMAAFHDPRFSPEQRKLLASYHAINMRANFGERREQGRRKNFSAEKKL
ncbi:hypothetical protein [Chitinibacter sp. S2-10]|uniref:hypothetical protein n=1 Tax=Chitinibacter sp. S2-10 TaxID=3373597 RepID=UPI003977869F